MAYNISRTATRGQRGRSGSTNISLEVNTPDGDYLCQSVKKYSEKSSIIQDLDNQDGFIHYLLLVNQLVP